MTPLDAEEPAPDRPEVSAERQQAAMMRAYRARIGTSEYRLLRGEIEMPPATAISH